MRQEINGRNQQQDYVENNAYGEGTFSRGKNNQSVIQKLENVEHYMIEEIHYHYKEREAENPGHSKVECLAYSEAPAENANHHYHYEDKKWIKQTV